MLSVCRNGSEVVFAKMFKRLTFELLPDKKTSLVGENALLVPAGDIGFIINERLLRRFYLKYLGLTDLQ